MRINIKIIAHRIYTTKTFIKISKYMLIACVWLCCALPTQSLAGFNTAQLIYRSMQVKCLDWQIIGLCFWLKCSPKCRIRVTPKISHYLPDLTVTNSAGQCPWQEAGLLSLKSPMNIVSQLAAKAVGGNPDGYQNITSAEVHDDEQWELWGDSDATSYQQCHASGGKWQQEMRDTVLAVSGRCVQQRSVQQRDVGDEATDRWQMIYPQVENECSSFDERAQQKNDWSAGKASAEAAYGYNFWQKYKCCIPGSGRYLFSIEW